MKKYFTANNRLVIYYLPEAGKTATLSSGRDRNASFARKGGR